MSQAGGRPTRRTSVIGISIGIAAERAGMHPQTLREYERQGLVQPQRTQGGARRYREAELERLTHIQQLTELGMSLAAVRHVLAMEEALRTAHQRVAELEHRLGMAPALPPTSELVRRSMSVALVHVPRLPRSPRWRHDH